VSKQRPFLMLWTAAVIATVAAFVLHLALRGKTVELGYKLGKARDEQARLREVKRVLSLEAASYETPQRVEMVARELLGMTPPPADRIIPVKAYAPSGKGDDDEGTTNASDVGAPMASDAGAGDGGAP
jgi:cell division protein FtsL